MATRPRRGVALLAALWLVVAIATVALQFSLEGRERRNVGILASERGIQRAAAMGALALTRARLEYALRVRPAGDNFARIRSYDPWLGVDSVYSGPVMVDSMVVDVQARDLGDRLNINRMSETQLQTFFSFLLGDFSKSVQLSQAIMDWRDPDSLARPSGAERDAYIKAELLALPMNASFREIEELQNVMGMTPEIFAEASPYLTTRGTSGVNLNSAPVPVLRALPGMTDATLNQILQQRSQGRRIDSPDQIFRPTGQRQVRGQVTSTATVNQAVSQATATTDEVELTITARVGPQAPPSRLIAILSRGSSAGVTFKTW